MNRSRKINNIIFSIFIPIIFDEVLREKYYETLFYKIIETETKSVKQDLIVTFCFKYFDYNRSIRNNQIERAKKSIETNQVTRTLEKEKIKMTIEDLLIL